MNFVVNFVDPLLGINSNDSHKSSTKFTIKFTTKVGEVLRSATATVAHTLVAKVHPLATLTFPQGYRNN